MLTRDQMNALADEALELSGADVGGVDYLFVEYEEFRSVGRPVSVGGIRFRFSPDADRRAAFSFATVLGDDSIKRELRRRNLTWMTLRRRLSRRRLPLVLRGRTFAWQGRVVCVSGWLARLFRLPPRVHWDVVEP